MDLIEYLVANPLFSDFSASELEALAQALTVTNYPDGHVFMKEGQRADAVYLITKGKVAVTRLNRQTRAIENLHTMTEGEMFGLIALIDHGKRTATCTAAGEVTAASLPIGAFELLYQSDAPIALHFQYLVARQLAHDMRALNRALLDLLLGRIESVPRALQAMPLEFGGSSEQV